MADDIVTKTKTYTDKVRTAMYGKEVRSISSREEMLEEKRPWGALCLKESMKSGHRHCC